VKRVYGTTKENEKAGKEWDRKGPLSSVLDKNAKKREGISICFIGITNHRSNPKALLINFAQHALKNFYFKVLVKDF
jgi:hypothetical protein